MQLTVKYESNVVLHPAVRRRIETIIENLQRTKSKTTSWWQTLLGHPPVVTSQVVERDEAIAAYAAILSSNCAERASFRIYDVGIAERTDDSQTWSIYYCQVSAGSVLAIDGLMFDEDVCEGSMPRSWVDLYWHQNHQGRRCLLGAVVSGALLVPRFHFKPYQTKWPYMPKPVVAGGNVEFLATNLCSLQTVPAPCAELTILAPLLELL